MKKELILSGLACANCAMKIEREVGKLPWIQVATVNFATVTLYIETEQPLTDCQQKQIEKIVHSFEPDIIISEKKELEPATVPIKKWIVLASGLLTFFAGWFIYYVLHFTQLEWLAIGLLMLSYIILAPKVLLRMVRNLLKGRIFDENFLMGVATIGALIIGEYAGAAAVMAFYQVGLFFQERAVDQSKNRLNSLLDIRPDHAHLIHGNHTHKVHPEKVNVGDFIQVKPGERIPLDGVISSGESQLDTSAITGESRLRPVAVGDLVQSGTINQSGLLVIEVTATFGESTATKIIRLVEEAASKKAPTESFITTFAKYYTPIVLLAGLLLAVIPPLFMGGDWYTWIYRSLIFLVISCPCALVLSVPLGFFSGIGSASAKGVLVKGGNYLEGLAKADIVVFDKTGTLTKGVFQVKQIVAADGFSEHDVLKYAAYGEVYSHHPLAQSVVSAYGEIIDASKVQQYEDIAGHGVSAVVDDMHILAGNKKLMAKYHIEVPHFTEPDTTILVAVAGTFAGAIFLGDQIKEDAVKAIKELQQLGVRKIVMLSGDKIEICQSVAQELGITDVYGELLPHEKVEKMEALLTEVAPGKSLVFVGDGINDAPVLARADVGVSMGGLGSDAAIEASDVVIMTDEPSKLATAIRLSRFTRKIVWQNIVFTFAIQVLFLFLGMVGIAQIWEAVFADVGVSILAVFNSRRILRK